MENFELRVRLSVLWLFNIIAELAMLVLAFAYPGTIEQIMKESVVYGPVEWFVSVIVILIPLVMAVLTLTLKHSINRWLNIILGIVITIIYFGNFLELTTSMPAAHILIVNIAAFIAPALIVWYSWKWKTKSLPDAPA